MIRRRLPLLLVIALAAPACITARAAGGPVTTPTGQVGAKVGGTIGAGWSGGEGRAWYVVEDLGFTLDATEHKPGAYGLAGIDYLDERGGTPFRVGPRGGAQVAFFPGPESNRGWSVLGVSAAIFPWSHENRGHYEHSEKGWDFDPFGDTRDFRNFGFELDASYRFALEEEHDDDWLIALRLVIELNSIPR